MRIDKNESVTLAGLVGECGARRVFIGFAPASLLSSHSFADVLDEATGKGYQRRFSESHSLEFRKYIQRPHSTTIPLTFNLRPSLDHRWRLKEEADNRATLVLNATDGPVLSQVDCQHRLGFLKDLDVPLAFMAFVGLSTREEMEIFSVINGKAKGLNSSLLDFHQSKLNDDLSAAKPEIYIALRLNEAPESPWHRRLDLGGDKTVGMHRYASLRTMQKAVRRFLRTSQILNSQGPDYAFNVVLAFWKAITQVLEAEWNSPRRHFVTKGIGVYSLMSLAGDLYAETERRGIHCDTVFFVGALSDFITNIDWSNSGPLRGFGGAAGADQALELLRAARKKNRLTVIGNAR